jgi:hypothetical protein
MSTKSASTAITSKTFLLAAALVAFCFCFASAHQSAPASQAAATPVQTTGARGLPPDGLPTDPPQPTAVKGAGDATSSFEYKIAIFVMAGAGVALLMQFFLLWRVRNLKAEDTLRSFGVVLIIMGTLFVIAAGYSSVQIAPALGLFGTIAGYLLGRSEKRGEEEKKEAKNV